MFDRLFERNSRKKAPKKCKTCKGKGQISYHEKDENGHPVMDIIIYETCPTCNGTGKINEDE